MVHSHHQWFNNVNVLSFYFLKDFIYLFLERGREGEKEEEKHQFVVASHMAPLGDPGTCPDWELNWRPPGSQAGTQSTEPHQTEHNVNALSTTELCP